MPFTPFIQLPEKPNANADSLQNVDTDDPRIQKYTEKYRSLKEQEADKMAEKIAKEKHKKRIDFLVELVKAAIVALLTLAVEHFADIVAFFQGLSPSE